MTDRQHDLASLAKALDCLVDLLCDTPATDVKTRQKLLRELKKAVTKLRARVAPPSQ